MLKFSTDKQEIITIDSLLKQGGEAAIYKITENRDLLAKIYHNPKQDTLEKIRWMITNPPEDLAYHHYKHRSYAWPERLLFNAQQQFVGFLMPRIRDAAPLLHLINPALRNKTGLVFDRRYLHRVAYNLSVVIESIHKQGYVVGDLNQHNIMFNRSALVTIIDNDSFQVSTNKGVFRCLVGVPEYTAPELQGIHFSKIDRNRFHDNFGLAVIIFQLLMNGNHPFRGKWLGSGDPPALAEKIAKGLFPYNRGPTFPSQPPPDAPRWETLPPEIAGLFIRCFIDGHSRPDQRPSPNEWSTVLKKTEQRLTQCRHCAEFFYAHLQSCPWCRK